MNLPQKVKKYIKTHRLIHRGDTIILGVSGGADSVALTHILWRLQHELGVRLHIAHFNHGLRRGAKADQKFVEHLSRMLNVPCTTGLWKGSKTPPHGSLEDLGRQKRLEFFIHLAKKIKAQKIALAHTQNDLAETVLMRLLRGAGLQGTRGILPKRELHGMTFIRPLLDTQRPEIEKYLKSHKLKFRRDPTNAQIKFLRNKIRLELLPLLQKKYNPNTIGALSNLAQNLTLDYDYLETQTKKILKKTAVFSRPNSRRRTAKINLSILSRQHPAIQRMIIRKCIEYVRKDSLSINLNHMRAIENLIKNQPVSTRILLPNDIIIKKMNKIISIYN